MIEKPFVDILLATYNGAGFLADQLKSLERQTHENWRLIARDDGSTDETLSMLTDFKHRFASGKVVLIDNGGRNLGAARSFSLLAQESTARYVMFCDQDDVWDVEKIAVTLTAMREAESDNDDVPLLVHTDLRVVDESLRTIAESFWRFQNVDPTRDSLNRLLVGNVVTGCAMMANRSLVNLALPVPRAAAMHDWWFALVAAACGRIVCLPDATIAYRQHSRNSVGAHQWGLRFVLRRVDMLLRKHDKVRELIQRMYRQGEALRERCNPNCPEEARETLARFCELPNMPPGRRRMTVIRHRFLTHGLVRNIGLLLSI